MGKTPILNSLLTLFSILFALAFVEIGFRFFSFYEDQRLQNEWQALGQKDFSIGADSNEDLKLKHIIRLSRNARIVYEIIPNLSVFFEGQRLKTNAQGFRGPGIDRQAAPNTIRIIGIGDSVMFDWAVDQDAYYLAILERLLGERYPGHTWESINAAVPGYNTVIEVETLKTKLLAMKPDIVIIDFVSNDLSLPNFVRKTGAYMSLDDSFLRRFIKSRRKRIKKLPDSRLEAAAESPSHDGFEDDPARIPDEYRDMVGIVAYRQAMQTLKHLSVEHGFRVLV